MSKTSDQAASSISPMPSPYGLASDETGYEDPARQPTSLTVFLLARIEEDEARWASAEPPFSSPHDPECDYPGDMLGICDCNLLTRLTSECEAKRRIVNEWQDAEALTDYPRGAVVMRRTMRFLALPYADHPDYRDEWKP